MLASFRASMRILQDRRDPPLKGSRSLHDCRHVRAILVSVKAAVLDFSAASRITGSGTMNHSRGLIG